MDKEQFINIWKHYLKTVTGMDDQDCLIRFKEDLEELIDNTRKQGYEQALDDYYRSSTMPLNTYTDEE